MSGARAIYSFEEIIPDATAQVFENAGFTAWTPSRSPQFQKQRPRTEFVFKSSGQHAGNNPRIALLPDGSKRNSAFVGELSIYAITDCDQPGKLVHAEYLSEVRSLCAVLGDLLNDTALKNHKIQQMVEGPTAIGYRTADGYQQSSISFTVYFSVQQYAWLLLGPMPASSFAVDQGFDPVLGPPYPTTFYMLLIDQQGGRAVLSWTVPDVIIAFDPEDPMFGDPGNGAPDLTVTYQCIVENYSWPEWDGATTYILNQRVTKDGTRYYSMIDGNIGNAPPNPSFWAVDDTLFKIYLRTVNTVTGDVQDFTLVGDSDNTASTYTNPGFAFAGYAWNGSAFAVGVQRTSPSELHELYFYVTATTGPITVYSQTAKFLVDL